MSDPTALCFVDVESDGVHPDRKPWEIGLILRRPGQLDVERQFFVEIDLATADRRGLQVGGFYDRHPLGRYLSERSYQCREPGEIGDYLTGEAAARMLARWTHDALIVGAVPNFDTETLDPLLRFWGLLPAWRHRLRCVETLTAGHLRREVGGLSDCAAALGVEHPDAHTALGDARAARAIWDAVMAGGAQ